MFSLTSDSLVFVAFVDDVYDHRVVPAASMIFLLDLEFGPYFFANSRFSLLTSNVPIMTVPRITLFTVWYCSTAAFTVYVLSALPTVL